MCRWVIRFFVILAVLAIPAAFALHRGDQPHPLQGDHSDLLEQLETSKVPYPRLDVKRVIDVFFAAVDRGEVIIINQYIDRSMLKPEHVEYLYTMNSKLPSVKVYSTLEQSISYPGINDLQISGVSAVLDLDGNIIEIIYHAGK